MTLNHTYLIKFKIIRFGISVNRIFILMKRSTDFKNDREFMEKV
jgi:hypothetical protein